MCKLTEMIMQTHGSPILVAAVNEIFCKLPSPIPKESLEAIQTEIGTFRYLMMHYRNNQAIVDPHSSMWWDHKKLIENMLNNFFKRSTQATIINGEKFEHLHLFLNEIDRLKEVQAKEAAASLELKQKLEIVQETAATSDKA